MVQPVQELEYMMKLSFEDQIWEIRWYLGIYSTFLYSMHLETNCESDLDIK